MRKRLDAGFFTACFVKIEILAKIGNVFLRCFAVATVGGGTQRERRFRRRRKDAKSLRTADVNVGAARRRRRGEIGVAGETRLAVATGRRSFSNEKRRDLGTLSQKVASD